METPATKPMTVRRFKKLFPLKAMVTQEIIDAANIDSSSYCIGALTLKSLFPTQWSSWARTDGHISIKEGRSMEQYIPLRTMGDVDMMEIKEPTEVTFMLK